MATSLTLDEMKDLLKATEQLDRELRWSGVGKVQPQSLSQFRGGVATENSAKKLSSDTAGVGTATILAGVLTVAGTMLMGPGGSAAGAVVGAAAGALVDKFRGEQKEAQKPPENLAVSKPQVTQALHANSLFQTKLSDSTESQEIEPEKSNQEENSSSMRSLK